MFVVPLEVPVKDLFVRQYKDRLGINISATRSLYFREMW